MLSVSYALIGALLLLVLVYARLPWPAKAAAVIVTSAFYVVSFVGSAACSAGPASTGCRPSFKLLQARIVDPHTVEGDPGSVYLWVEALDDDNRPSGVPRAYRLPYNDALADKTHTAADQIAAGHPQGGRAADFGTGEGGMIDAAREYILPKTIIETSGGDPSTGEFKAGVTGRRRRLLHAAVAAADAAEGPGAVGDGSLLRRPFWRGRRAVQVISACRPAAMSTSVLENLPYVPTCLPANFVATSRISRGERVEARLAAKSSWSRAISMNSVWQASMPAIAFNGPAIGPVMGPARGRSAFGEELAVLASPMAAWTGSSASARASTGRSTSGFGSARCRGSVGFASSSGGGTGGSALSMSLSIFWPESSGSLVSVTGEACSSSPSEPVKAGTETARSGVDAGFATPVAPASVLRGLLVLRLLISAFLCGVAGR